MINLIKKLFGIKPKQKTTSSTISKSTFTPVHKPTSSYSKLTYEPQTPLHMDMLNPLNPLSPISPYFIGRDNDTSIPDNVPSHNHDSFPSSDNSSNISFDNDSTSMSSNDYSPSFSSEPSYSSDSYSSDSYSSSDSSYSSPSTDY